MSNGWTFQLEHHLGDPAYSLFDPSGDRAGVGLTRQDAAAICRAKNAEPDLVKIIRRAIGDLNIIGCGTVDKDHAAVYARDMAAEIEEDLAKATSQQVEA